MFQLQQIEKAEQVVDNEITELEDAPDALIITLGVSGGLMLLALLGTGGFILYKKSQPKTSYNEVSF